MEVGTDSYSALYVFEASEPARGDEKDSLDIAVQIVCFLGEGGERNGKWMFTACFECNVYPSS